MKGIFVLLVLVACFAAAQSATPTKTTPSDDEKVLLDADRAFSRDTSKRRLDGWMGFMADDAVLFSTKPVVGKDAIRAFYEPAFADAAFVLTWQPTRAEMFPSGDTGYTTGRYELHAKDAKGNKVVRHGSYLTVWKRQPDGSWKVIADGGAPDAH